MSFPFEDYEKKEESVLREYAIDFSTGKITGEIVEGIEAIKVWIYLALNTKRYKNPCHTWDYGQELDDLIGKGFSEEHIESEVERIITDCLTINEHISGIKNLTINYDRDTLTASFTVVTDYGEVEENV